MTRSRIAMIPLALALTVTACASAPRSSGPSLEGCWFFDAGEATTALRLPEGVRLTGDTLEGWPAIQQRGNVRVAVTLTGNGSADYPFGYWLRESADSVEIGYPAGGGIVLDLEVAGRVLRGTARALGDTQPYGREDGPPRSLPVRLDAGACP